MPKHNDCTRESLGEDEDLFVSDEDAATEDDLPGRTKRRPRKPRIKKTKSEGKEEKP